MPRTLLRTAFAAVLLVGGVATFAVTSIDRATALGHGDGALDDAMNGLKDNLRALNGTIGDAAGDADTLATLGTMQRIALDAKPLEPSNMASVPADKRAAHLADYRRDMARLLGELVDMELLVLDGKHAEAKERIKTGLIELRNSAHDKFQEH